MAVVVVCDRPGRGRPSAVAGHPHPLAAAQFNGELQQADGGGPVGLAVAGRRGHVVLGAVPAVAEHEPHRVAAGPQEAGHVVGGVEHPRAQLEGLVVVVVGGGRVQRLVADPAAVDVQLVVPEPGDVAPGPLRRTGQPELLAQQRRGHGRVGADPRRGPVPRRQQRHLEDGRGAVGAPAAVAVPDLHLPPAPLAAAQRGPGVSDAGGGVGGHPTGVPLVARPGIQDAGGGGHQHPVGRLAPVPPGGADSPGEARCRPVDAERVDQVLAAGIGGREPVRPVDGLSHGNPDRRTRSKPRQVSAELVAPRLTRDGRSRRGRLSARHRAEN